MPKPTAPVYPQYVKGPQGNLIGVRGPVQMYPPLGPANPAPPTHDVPFHPPVLIGPVRHPPIIYPPDPKPPVRIQPMPPIRVGPYPLPVPPRYYPQPRRRPKRHRRHRGPHRARHPVFIKVAPPVATAPPIRVPVAPIVTGKICPSWGWMVKTNEDGSETVIKCQPGQPGAPGLHGLDGITETMEGALGPNWMLYIGAGLALWYFMKKR